jgi:hypothetical protein
MVHTVSRRIVELRCGRVRSDRTRCRRLLNKITIGDDGTLGWLMHGAIVGPGQEAPRGWNPPIPAMLPEVHDRILRGEPSVRWKLPCHRRCGAEYTVTRRQLLDLDPSEPVAYLGGPTRS